MVKKQLIKLRHSLVMRTKKSFIFDTYFRWQLVMFLDYFLFPEFNDDFAAVVKHNRTLITIVSSILLLFGVFFFLGKSTQDNILRDLNRTISSKESMINFTREVLFHKDETIDNLRNDMNSREFIDFKANKYSKIQNFDNFLKLPDDEAFLMNDQYLKNEIPVSIYFRIPDRESAFLFIPNKDGSGALGYFQVMDATFDMYYRKLHLTGGHNHRNNIIVGSTLLKDMFNSWKERGIKTDKEAWRYTIAEYNTGLGNMTKLDDNKKVIGYFVPNYTNDYVSYIMKYYQD